MKKILVACGTGVVTSTIAVNRIKDGLKQRGLEKEAEITQCKIAEIASKAHMFDFVVTTTQAPSGISVPVLNGLPLLTRVGEAKLHDQIAELVKG